MGLGSRLGPGDNNKAVPDQADSSCLHVTRQDRTLKTGSVRYRPLVDKRPHTPDCKYMKNRRAFTTMPLALRPKSFNLECVLCSGSLAANLTDRLTGLRIQFKGESFGKHDVLPMSYRENTGPPSSTGIVPLLFYIRSGGASLVMGVVDRALMTHTGYLVQV